MLSKSLINCFSSRLNTVAKSNQRSLEMNAKLRIQMSSVRYIHTKRFIMEIHLFLKDLLELQSVSIWKFVNVNVHMARKVYRI